MAIDEYVPMRIPKRIAKLKPLRPGPPKTYITKTTINVQTDVSRVLDIVWLMLFEMVWAVNCALCRFSRIRSNTTMVSLIE